MKCSKLFDSLNLRATMTFVQLPIRIAFFHICVSPLRSPNTNDAVCNITGHETEYEGETF